MASSPNVLDITSLEQFNKLIADNKVVAIQAHASWCGPCKAISPIFNKLANENAIESKYLFARFDTDDVPDLATELGIRSIPAFFSFENGDKGTGVTGANPAALTKLVKELAATANGGDEAKPLNTSEDF